MTLPASTAPSGGRRARARIVPALSPEHVRHERDLLAAPRCLPVPHRVEWLRAFGGPAALFCAAEDAAGRCEAGFAIQVAASRALPGHRLLRVERYTPPPSADAEAAMLEALREHARRDGRVLRVSLEIHCREPGRRATTERVLDRLGFVRCATSRRYEHTLAIDLHPTEAALMEALHSTARKNIRTAAKHPVEVRPVEEPVWAERLAALLEESMGRTGGRAKPYDWPGLIAFSGRFPELSRIVGLFRKDVSGPESLVAFALGFGHGEYAHYDASGATRTSGIRIPMTYPLLWDLILWAKRSSALWFDLGGVTVSQEDGQDALEGISSFKRFFSREVVEVGAEWVLTPRPIREQIARAVGATAGRLRALRRG
jgi:hypothetical protein